MNRIAPNNQLPATHFIEVYRNTDYEVETNDLLTIDSLKYELMKTISYNFTTIAIFRIRENKLPTKHKF